MDRKSPFAAAAAELWRRAEADGKPLGLVVAAVDQLGAYADFHGQPAADACEHCVLHCLQALLRGETDRITRLGGGTTAVLLPGIGAAAAGEVAERLRVAIAALAIPHLGLTPVGMITLSLGVASLSPGQGRDVNELFVAAERALRTAGRAGGDTVRIAVACGALTGAGLL